MTEFKVGDVVYLNSDPSMKFTVNNVISRGGIKMIELAYFNHQNERFEYHQLAPELLKLVDEIG